MPALENSKRRFKSPYWDVPPVGFNHVTPEEYKKMQTAGQVPQTVVNPSSQHLQGTKYARPSQTDPMEAVRAAAAVINATLLGKPGGNLMPGSAGSKAMSGPPAITRQARRLYVGNIPFGCTDTELMEFFRANMDSCNFVREPGCPVLACQINLDKNFAFLEFRTVEETTSAIALDGIMCKGQALKIRRPHDYQPNQGPEQPASVITGTAFSGSYVNKITGPTQRAVTRPVPHVSGAVPGTVSDSPNKIYIGGIPTYLTDDQIREILSSFGPIKAFNLIRDPTTLASKGYAFCEYIEPSTTEGAILGLNGFDIGDKKLIVQRASLGAKSGGHANSTIGTTSNSISSVMTSSAPHVQIQVPGLPSVQPTLVPRVLTEVVCLMNMVEPKELLDDQEYGDILEDIVEECQKYGGVRSIQIPRPSRSDPVGHVPGLGKVFVEFNSATEAQRALMNLAGRKFANRTVVASYFDRERYQNKEF